jgi:hypothetical protein
MTTPRQAALVERLRALLAAEPSVRVVPMFGGRSFMLDDRMVVSALKNGDLRVRAGAHRHDELVARPGARRAEMGTGRAMGPGWIHVDAAAVADDGLADWLGVALDHHRATAP